MQEHDTDWTIPPGAILREWLDENGETQVDLARLIGWSQKFVSHLVTGKAVLTLNTALLLEEHTGVSAQFWLNGESNYRVDLAKGKKVGR
jgi:HTH-type transcriptional regulator / antitoxin HigA